MEDSDIQRRIQRCYETRPESLGQYCGDHNLHGLAVGGESKAQSCYSTARWGLPELTYGTYIIESEECSQQGNPLSGLQFCETVHPTLSGGTARTKLGFVDDFNLEGKISDAAKDVQTIIEAQAATGLVLNRHHREQLRPRRQIPDFQ